MLAALVALPELTADEPRLFRSGPDAVPLLGAGIMSEVKRGENRGRRLRHEFVALAWRSAPLRDGRVAMVLPAAPADLTVARTAVAVWVSRPDDPTPLQATGGWLR